MRVALLFSGGKDSTYASWLVQHQGWDLSLLLTLSPSTQDSMMFHYPNVKWTRLQAQALDVKQHIVQTSPDNELDELEGSLREVKKQYSLNGLVTGAVASDYQKSKIDQICDRLGLKTYSPLWHKPSNKLVNDLHQAGLTIILTRVAANGLDSSWLGHVLTGADWDRLTILSKKYDFNLTGEGGEYETFVVDAPHFTKRVEIEKGSVKSDGDANTFVIEAASLREKH